jgi:YXWGXW repeat-containing protein
MKTKLLAMMLLAGGSMFAQTRFSIGLGFGTQGAGFYQAPPAYAANIPPCPGPGYTWVDGYWTNDYGRQVWVPGYWNAPIFTFQSGPRFGNRFFNRNDHRFVDRDDHRFVNRDDHRFGDRDNRQSFAGAPQQSSANGNRSNGRDNRQRH